MTLQLEAVQVDPSKYEEILDFTNGSVPFHFTYAALKYLKDERLDGAKLSLFQVLNEQQRLYCVLHELAGESVQILINTDSHDLEFVRAATLAMIDKIHPILDQYQSFYSAYTRQDIREIMINCPKIAASHSYRPMEEPGRCFYMNDEQCNTLKEQQVQLPTDYSFIDLEEKHAKKVCKTQFKGVTVEEKLVALRLRNFPAVGAVIKNDEGKEKLVCYVYTDGLGAISMPNCKPGHRGKKLGIFVEQKLCQRNLAETGVRPFKGISVNRPRIMEMTVNSELWTTCKDGDGLDETFYCSVYFRENLRPILFYDN